MKIKILITIILCTFQIQLFAEKNNPDENNLTMNNSNIINHDAGFDISTFLLYDKTLSWVKFYQKTDDNFFLSNFYGAQLEIFGYTFPRSEHAYQSQKFIPNSPTYLAFIDPQNASPEMAYKLGQTKDSPDARYPVLHDWKMERDQVMYAVVSAKFAQNKMLMDKLLNTGNALLVEWTENQKSGDDTFWGINRTTLQGKNHLGKILMIVREKFRGNIQQFEIQQILEGLKNDNLNLF